MISPSSLLSRLGVGGRLVAFFKAVCVYFVVGGEGGGQGPSMGGVAAKCAPVLCLLLSVLAQLHAAPPPPPHASPEDKARAARRAAYARKVAAGLALSALGDALLAWPQHFVAGMAAFAGAHLAYLAAFGFRQRAPRAAVLCYTATALFLPLLRPGGWLRLLVPLYALLLASMCWRGVARGGPAAPGAVLFLLSDAALGYTMFAAPLPYRQVIVMSTYYLGQLGIALSALEPLRPAPAH